MPLPYTETVEYERTWHGGLWRDLPDTTRPAPPLPRRGRIPTHAGPHRTPAPTASALRRRKSCTRCGTRIHASLATICWRCRVTSTPGPSTFAGESEARAT